MKVKSLLKALRKFFSSLSYIVVFVVVVVVFLAIFYGINWAFSWAGCWLLYNQYPPPNMVDSFDVIPDHFQMGEPYLIGWATIMLLSLCLAYAVSLCVKYFKRWVKPSAEESRPKETADEA